MTDPLTAKTLDELDPPAWGKPSYDSYLSITCHRLRKKPIGDFSVEDLRIMIGQGIGLPWLIPLALRVLERDPLSEGDFYPGDLLGSVLRVEKTFWERESESRDRLFRVLDGLDEFPKELNDAVALFRKNTV
jgi:CDI immunity proteins